MKFGMNSAKVKMMQMAMKGMIKKAGFDPDEIEKLIKQELEKSPELSKNPQELVQKVLKKAKRN